MLKLFLQVPISLLSGGRGTMYKVTISKQAVKQFSKIATAYQGAIREAIDGLAEDPRPDGCKKMKGCDETYRIKVGKKYRVIYIIDDGALLVEVIEAGTRGSVY
jgi:mRNA interferase RelE/StbE